jgi:DNA (cytosine-5)-methyltransferase 1
MRHLSLCAGIGGIDLGLHRCIKGLRTVAMVEREAFCIAQLVTKMQAGELDAAPIYPDLHRFPWSKYRGCVDLVSGGIPCQPFSQAGLRKATEDPRHLWPVIKSGLAVLRPRACFFENVDGIVCAPSAGFHSVLHNVLCDLERLGFRSTAGCFTASELGAPHKRKRWFILGTTPNGLADTHNSRGRENIELPKLWAEGFGKPSDSCRSPTKAEELDEGYRWPSGPSPAQFEWEARRTVERSVGGSTDGLSGELEQCPNRRDRLRALGNAVVPGTSARAFATLWYELNPERN